MSSLDAAPPLDQEQTQASADAAAGNGAPEEELDSNPAELVGAERSFIREDWSEALQKFIAGREGDASPKTATLGGEAVAGPDTDTGSVGEIVVGGGSVAEVSNMGEAESMASESGEVAVAGESAPLKSESEAAAGVQVGNEVEGASSGDVERKALEVEAGEDVVLASESGENGDASADVSGDESAEDGVVEAVEEVLEVAPANAEPDVEAAGLDSVVIPSEDVEEKGVEVNSEEPATVVSAEVPVEELSEKFDSAALDAPVEGVEEPSPTDDVEEKAIEVNSGDGFEVNSGDGFEVTEEASPDVPAEESLDNVDSEALHVPVEEIADVVDSATSAETDDEPASQEEENPKTSEEEPTEGIDSSVEIVGGSVAEESIEKTEPSEAVDAHVEQVATSGDVEDKPVEVDARDVNERGNEEASLETPVEALDASVEEVVPPTDAEPGVKSAILESVLFPSHGVEEKVVEVNSEEATPDEVDSQARDAHVEEETTSAEPNEEVSEVEAVSALTDNVKEKSIEVNSGDGSEGANVKEASPAEEAPEKVDSEAVDAPVEESGATVEGAATGAEADVQSTSEEVEPQMPLSETEEQSTTMATSTALPAEEELFDLLQWESIDRTTSDTVADNSQDSPTEGISSEREAEIVSAEDRTFQVEELPQESEAESQIQRIPTEAEVNKGEVAETPDTQSITAKEDLSEPPMISSTVDFFSVPIEHTSEEPYDALAEPCDKNPLTGELEHPTASAASIPSIIGSEAKELPNADDDVANGTIKAVGDVSHLLQAVMTDEEVKAAASGVIHSPEEAVEAGRQVLEFETVHEESGASGASQEKEVETLAREFNLNDISEAPVTSEVVGDSGDDLASHVVTPYLATALAAASSESEEEAPKSYSLDEMATHLHDAAAKTLQDAEASDVGKKQSSVAKAVAQIVLEESSNAKDSSEYISGVVQHVAQFAQDAGQSDPNVLPDTVARVFGGETAASPANHVTQPKETTSLGTMVSLFVIWCVSLCASRVSSKDMPAPPLKLAAEEVSAVLHSNAPSQPTPVQGHATSSH